MSEARRTTAHIAGLMLAKVLRAPLWLLISAALARVLEPAGLGAWSMILAAATFLNQLLLHWTQSITQRYGRGEWLQTGRLAQTWAVRWPALAVGLAVVVLLLLADPFAWAERFYGLAGELRWFVLPAMLTVWLMAEAQGLQQVRERFAALALSPIVADLLVLATIGLLAWKGGIDLGFALACLTAVGCLTWLAWLAAALAGCRPSLRLPEAEPWRRALRFAAPLVPGFVVGYLAEWCDYFLIRHFYSAVEVGLFHPAYQYLLIMVGLPTALATVLIPQVIAKAGGAAVAVARLVAADAPRYTVAWALVALPVMAVLPAVFAWLLGARYAGSVPVLQILLIAVPGAVVQHVYGIAHFVQGRLAVSTSLLFGVKCLVNLAVSATLLPTLGVAGSAIGAVCSYLVLQWLFLLDQHRHLRLRIGAGAVALLAVQLAGLALALVDGGWTRLLVATLACLALLALARRAALFARDDVAAMIPRPFAALAAPACWLLCGRR